MEHVRKTLILAGLVLANLITAGCREKHQRPIVNLYAGAGLRRGIEALAEEFTRQTGIEVVPDYAGGGTHIARARESADVDLFMPGDVWYVDRLQELSGKVESKTPVAYFVPVIIVAKGNPKRITGLKDFFRPDVQVALGRAKACQVGRISGKILENAGLDRSKLNAKESLTVNELGVWVKMGDVDAAIVWDAIAANIADSVDVIKIPEEYNVISRVVVGLMKTSKHKEAAKKFVEFMTSQKGRAILNSKGYRTEPPS